MHVHRVVSVCAGLLLCASSVLAQDLTMDAAPAGEIAAGFALVGFTDVNVRPTCIELRLPCGSGKTFGDYGGALSAAVQVTDTMALVGETDIYANNWQTPDSLYSTTNRVWAALAGLRVSSPMFRPWRRDPQRLRLFVQLLYGVETSDAASGGRAVQPGAGADFSTRYPIRLRVQWDYTAVSHQLRDLSAGRVMVALVVPFEGS
jgi:hypothetical protein